MAGDIQIDASECLGCESCVEICPSVFQMSGDVATVLNASATDACVEEAMDICPVSCISREE